ncbi:hypothetical protein [Streptomyces sp. HPF1205]|uniref:hypothetical protein n=1 Tax=Streptomyces sp. HPF1205 TaxID=2873262 RepID=UPI001CED9C76|nr:hypothetical protein [Streptomyces sp. HPF1205]
MSTIRLGCGRAGTLFYEPDGLLLRSCLIPVSSRHGEHLLTFQLGYLGPGEITVHIALEGDTGALSSPKNTTALLRGTDADDEDEDGESAHRRIPGVWLTYATVPEREVAYRYTVSGQPAEADDHLRGELVTEISGRLPLLTATTLAQATREPLPEGVRSQPVMDWDQADGSGAEPCCPYSARPRAVQRSRPHHRALGPMRNICT